jgi:hypothetical protein
LDPEHLTQYQFKLVVEVLVHHHPIRVEEQVVVEHLHILEMHLQQQQLVEVVVALKRCQEQMLLVEVLVVVEED